MRSLIITALMLAATPAHACIRSTLGFNFSDQVNNELAYLICLHNEQNDRLNAQGEVIDRLLATIGSNDVSMQLMQREIDKLKSQIQTSGNIIDPPATQPMSAEDKIETDKALAEIRRIVESNQVKPRSAP